VLILFVREEPAAGPDNAAAGHVPGDGIVSRFSRTDDPRVATAAPQPFPRELTSFFLVLTLFTLGNSTDAFLLLKLTGVAGSAQYIPLLWAVLHLVKASVSVLAGGWSDHIGRRTVIGAGWLVYAAVYVGFATADTMVPLVARFIVYGVYFGFAEGAEKALVADLAPAARRGYAYGIYNAVIGIGALLASVLFGVLWSTFGAHVAFATGAALSLVATVLLFAVVRR
jgi:MFS family permease